MNRNFRKISVPFDFEPEFSEILVEWNAPHAHSSSFQFHEAKMAEWKTKIPVPQQLLVPLSVPNVLLLGPGPANPSLRTYNASAMPLLGHLHPEFCKIMDETKAGLQYVFQTRNEYTLAITGAGHAAMEASIMNLVERGERILVCVNGMWGSRAREIAERQGKI